MRTRFHGECVAAAVICIRAAHNTNPGREAAKKSVTGDTGGIYLLGSDRQKEASVSVASLEGRAETQDKRRGGAAPWKVALLLRWAGELSEGSVDESVLNVCCARKSSVGFSKLFDDDAG